MTRTSASPAGARLQRWLLARWFAPSAGLVSTLLGPMVALYRAVAALHRTRAERARDDLLTAGLQPRLPVLVVGNLIVGGAGKTPTTLALLGGLRALGWHPGVVSRGYGRQGDHPQEVTPSSTPREVGDEPLLLRHRSGVPVWVGADRVAAARALEREHPEVDLIVCDDALQHRRLRRDVEVWVFDERGVGNGRLLPAGPLREPLPRDIAAQALVLYNHSKPTTPLPGTCARRRVAGVWPLDDWLRGRGTPGQPLAALRHRKLLAMAGIAVPARFFALLDDAGLSYVPLPLPDHHGYAAAPWPEDATDIVTTEKDAVKLSPWRAQNPRIWVVGLDLELPPAFVSEVSARLRHSPFSRPTNPAPDLPP